MTVGFAAVAAAALGLSAGGTGAASAPCRVTNAEAIVDDSGSMRTTDRRQLRMSAVYLLIDKPSNASKKLGAVDFGTNAAAIFHPQTIGPNAGNMKRLLYNYLSGDSGGTDYNKAFQVGRAENSSAQGWLFLTDGAHNAGAYLNGHRGLAPVMVIGLGIGFSGQGNADADRLQQIANETGGRYFPAQDASTLQSTVNTIDALWSCAPAPRAFEDHFSKTGQAIKHSVAVPKGAKAEEIATTYSDPGSRFEIVGIQIVRGGRIVAAGHIGRAVSERKRPRRVKLKLTKVQGRTYTIVRVGNVVPGQLRFKVRARFLGTETKVTTQVGRR